ncbi:hypothetical protein ACHAXS_002666 [Conticribra weissflogii]
MKNVSSTIQSSRTRSSSIILGSNPDYLLQICVRLIIVATNEVEHRIDNLSKHKEYDGLKPFPNFEQFIQMNYLKAFVTGFPYLWAPCKYWHMEKSDVLWDMFLPFLDNFNTICHNLVHIIYLSMSGWHPKMSKIGGLLNITFKPCKPVNLGMVICNCVECKATIFVNHDIVRGVEDQD